MLKELAKQILVDNQYMTLATVDKNGEAWVSPVAYAYDGKKCLYFMSLTSSAHCQNLLKKPTLAFAIFDSRQEFGKGVGLQIKAQAEIVPLYKNPTAMRFYFGRKWPYGKPGTVSEFKKFFKKYKYRFYKLSLAEVWMNDPSVEYDRRVKVRL